MDEGSQAVERRSSLSNQQGIGGSMSLGSPRSNKSLMVSTAGLSWLLWDRNVLVIAVTLDIALLSGQHGSSCFRN